MIFHPFNIPFFFLYIDAIKLFIYIYDESSEKKDWYEIKKKKKKLQIYNRRNVYTLVKIQRKNSFSEEIYVIALCGTQ